MRKGLILLTLSSLIYVTSGYITNLFLGRFLGPADYGVFGILISLIGIVNIIQSNGIPNACSKYISEKSKSSEEIYKSSLYLQIIVTIFATLIFFLLANPISILLGDAGLEQYIRIISVTLPLYSLFSLFIGYYNGLHLFKKQAIITIIYSFAKIIFIIILGYLFNLYGAILGFIISSIPSIIVGFKFPNIQTKFFPLKTLTLFSITIIGFSLFSYLQQSIDLYFVKALVPFKEATGYYTANQNISKVTFFALSAFSGVVFPSISKNIGLNLHHQNKKLIHQVLRVVFMFLTPVTLLISATSGLLLSLLYSNIYLPAAPSLSILIIGVSFLTVFTILASILNGAGEPNRPLWISVLGLVITSFFCMVLIPSYGLVGAAIATTIGAFASMCLAAYFVYQRFNALINPKRIIRITLCSLFIYFLASLIPGRPIYLPVMYVFLFAIYIVILILIKEITIKDFVYVNNMVPSKYKPTFLKKYE